ncbi:CoA-binding protein [Peredibacter starrii]|uniref:CoA-binding protein n=1 Tax=Peredibacter starrii TaxID=28202 RepID=A0AAX4HVE9_9BACT|nr:CoA-binding protein [Peredibacter starrii]WPU67160.1 CoA-binding protein [Peredibacter starrii]
MEVVAVIGASSDTNRYSYKAMEMLEEYGHTPVPVHPREEVVRGVKVTHNLGDLAGQKIDTVTVYVNPAISDKYEKDLIAVNPKRVIFNPGAENPRLEAALAKNGIQVENACTLVLLRTNQF